MSQGEELGQQNTEGQIEELRERNNSLLWECEQSTIKANSVGSKIAFLEAELKRAKANNTELEEIVESLRGGLSARDTALRGYHEREETTQAEMSIVVQRNAKLQSMLRAIDRMDSALSAGGADGDTPGADSDTFGGGGSSGSGAVEGDVSDGGNGGGETVDSVDENRDKGSEEKSADEETGKDGKVDQVASEDNQQDRTSSSSSSAAPATAAESPDPVDLDKWDWQAARHGLLALVRSLQRRLAELSSAHQQLTKDKEEAAASSQRQISQLVAMHVGRGEAEEAPGGETWTQWAASYSPF